jgi:uncharacterized membrane protein YqjE
VSSPKHQRNDPDGVGAVPYIPLTPDDDTVTGDRSIGKLVGDATQHMSTLVRAEVELAKAELVGEAKKALKGAIFFIIALVILLYCSFFLFFTIAEAFKTFLPAWLAFLIVTAAMVLTAVTIGFLGYRKFKKLQAPERTIGSFKDTAAALKPGQHPESVPSVEA